MIATQRLRPSGLVAAVLCLTATTSLFALNAPTLVKPTHNSTGYVPHPSFSWSTVSGATSYKVEIATDTSFTDLVATREGLTLPRYVPLTALAADTYYWRVTAVDGSTTAVSTTFTHHVATPSNTTTIGSSDSLATIRTKLAVAAATTGSVVNFPVNGSFVFDLTNESATYLFTLSGATDLIINGRGTEIVLKNKLKTGFLRITDSTRVTVRDLVVDYDPVPHSLVKVIANNSASHLPAQHLDLDVELMPITGKTSAYYPELTNNSGFTDHWSWATLLDKNNRGRLKPGVSGSFGIAPADATRTNGSNVPARYRIYHENSSSGPAFAVNDIIAIVCRTGTAPLASTGNVTDMTFAGITSYASPMGDFYSYDGTEFKVLNCRSILRDASRYVSANADGVHTRANPIGPWIEGCTFVGNADDGVALYNKGIAITAKNSTTSLTVSSAYMNLKTGDVFRVFNPATGAFLGSNYTAGTVTSTTVAFSPALSQADYDAITIPTADDLKFQLFNASRRNDRFMVTGNTFTVRGRGAIVRSATGMIENNAFLGCSSPAVALYNEAAFWCNGSYSRYVSILGNNIEDCGFDPLGLDAGAITVRFNKVGTSGSQSGNALSDQKVHEVIVIADNIIKNFAQHGIFFANATNSILTANTFVSDVAGFVHPGDHHGITVRQTYGTIVADNSFWDEGRALTSVVHSENNSNFTATNNTPPVTLDNTDSAGVTITGGWSAGTGIAGYYGSNYLFADGIGKSVRFTPTLATAGTYEVQVRWTAHANRASNAPLEIHRDGGTTAISMNQQTNGSQWVSFGTFSMTPSSNHGVTIKTDGANGYVVADAVRFILIE